MAKHPVKVFLDSNVILSGLVSERGAPRLILDVLTLRLPALQGATGEYNILEIERNLARKMPNFLPIYRKYLPLLGPGDRAFACTRNNSGYGGTERR
jgi:predicted nucleic acid-binding protein